MKMPRMETPTHYVFVGIHDSLDEAMRMATAETVEFLQKKEGLDFYDAYALTSATVDFTVARALMPAQMVTAWSRRHLTRRRRRTGTRGRCRRSTERMAVSVE